MIITDLIPEVNKETNNYITNLQSKYNEFKRVSEVLPLYSNSKIFEDKLPKKTGILYNSIFDIVKNRYSYLFIFKNYTHTGYLANALIDHYFRECVLLNEQVEQILYVDTKLLVQDYIRIIGGNSNDVEPALTYTKDTLYREVELAPCVIWDNFNSLTSDYEKTKITELLNFRYKKLLGNLFFIDGGLSTLSKYTEQLAMVMNIDTAVNCYEEDVNYIDDMNYNYFIKGGWTNSGR